MGSNSSKAGKAELGFVFLLLCIVLTLLFYRAWGPGHVLFSNDGPLGAQVMEAHRLPAIFSGAWQDLNSVGFREAGASPNLTFGLLYVLGPFWYSKMYTPFGLLVLGLGAWCFFRQLGLARIACVLGALATTLNSAYFSAACWGVASHALCIGMVFFSLAALVNTSSRWGWLRVAAGGAALGLAVSEGADIGAIFSLYVALFVVYLAWAADGHTMRAIAAGVGRVVVVAGMAALVAAQLISVLIGTQIQGVAGMQQDTRTKQERWDWATQWSLPKREALTYLVPGLFGYRMDTPGGGVYWGAVGRDPAWYRYWEGGSQGPPPQGGKRFSGGGIYAGILVVLVGFWAALQAFRKEDSVFPNLPRRLIWFWAGVVVVSLLLAFGRFAPFYQILYALPYFSTIRNPGKFGHVVTMGLLILFAYGLDGLWRRYMAVQSVAYAGLKDTVLGWWKQVRGFDRRWTAWSVVVFVACLLAWLVYASSRQGLEKYLQEVDFDAAIASAIASFSYAQVGWFVLTLAIGVGLLTLVLSGVFSGTRAKWGAVILGLFLTLDLGRANQPWIIPWDYTHKYATNPVIEMLRQRPYEQRVAILPRWFGQVFNLTPQLANEEQLIGYLYGIEWSQHLFLYYNIQSLDVIQMPRMPEDLLAFDMTFTPRSGDQLPRVGRKWQLTNTRYLIGAAAFLDTLNQAIDPVQHRFRYKERFTIRSKPGCPPSNNAQDWTAVPDTNGPFAVFEFTGALPRVRLYSTWQSSTNDQAALQQLASPSFDPEQSVIVHGTVPAPAATSTNQGAAKVEFFSYAPKHIVLKAEPAAPSVLLLNDRYDPNWKVWVDGKSETLLKCNYLMRGVLLQPGQHTVEFRFEPPMNSFYVSLAGVGLGILLCGLLLVVRRGPEPEAAPPAPVKTERKNPKVASTLK